MKEGDRRMKGGDRGGWRGQRRMKGGDRGG